MKSFMLAALVICYFVSKGQNTDSFRLSGTINTDSGTIRLIPDETVSAAGRDLIFAAVPVIHGKFTVRGKIDHPSLVMLILDTGGVHVYISGRFFIDTGEQSIVCDMQAMRDIPSIDNIPMKEYTHQYRSDSFQAIDTITNYKFRDSLLKRHLYQYAKKYPDSWVALWMISHELAFNGYDQMMDSALNLLSGNIRKSNIGIAVKNDLEHLAITGLGIRFPKIKVYSANGKPGVLEYLDENPQYILIDFWFSHCSPCIGQFPDYKRIVKQFQHKGFTMIGVSSDSSARDIALWKNIIQSSALSWVQYRVAQETLNDLRIYYAPTNFLLDSKGRILAIDMETKELADFLKTHLNQEVSSSVIPATRIQSKLE